MIYKTKVYVQLFGQSLSHHRHNIMCTVHCADRLLAKETSIKSYHELVRPPHAVPPYNTNANKAQHKD